MLDGTRVTIKNEAVQQSLSAHAEGRRRWPESKRLVTVRQEIAFRLRHQDFFGLSTENAAEVLGIDEREIRYLNERMKEVAPQVFPILPPRTAEIYRLFVENSMTVAEIAEELEISPVTVYGLVRKLYDERTSIGLYFRSNAGRRLSYQPWMDNHIRHKF
jgi:DNA-binding NarL/FixJ family response regulator